MDDARKLCSASKKLEESQRLQLIGHHDSRLIYFFTGKGKQSFEEMVYENVCKALRITVARRLTGVTLRWL